ncbi:MAG: hypothetical protein GVY19_11070 [Bacteroidetes bacterium]|jgi:hypothetical protein|nr:hypothetical protein [Bacteroidota bacterium]
MTIRYAYIIIILFCAVAANRINAQELDDLESLLKVEVENIDPVYKPVISVGSGVLSYYGDIRNNYQTPTSGDLGYLVNVSAYLGDHRYLRGNIYFMLGTLSANQRAYENLNENFNFATTINLFGINVDYDFDHFISRKKRIHPYVSLGIENILFNTKTDALNANGEPYVYTSGGLITTPSGELTQRDFEPDTDLKLEETNNNLSLAVPVEVGFDIQVADRFMIRLGSSIHYLLSDNIDQVTEKTRPDLNVNKDISDFFTYTYFTLNLDLFSEDKTLTYERFFVDVDFDYEMYGDEDNDMVYDGWDECLETPYGVKVDSTGCPLDDDMDGVPNYQDNEPGTAPGAFVDENGVAIEDDELIARLDNSDAVNRNEVALYIRDRSSYSQYYRQRNVEIPEKFEFLDSDEDEYISFDEMLNAIDMYFDFEAELDADDIYELNSLFFAQ